jgi:hypothetical protein
MTSGAAYVSSRGNGGGWSQRAKLAASDAAAGDQFGWSVALWGDRALVGAALADALFTDEGAAYLFEHDGLGGWTEVDKLTASDADVDQRLGNAVALSGSRVLASAHLDDDGGTDRGAAYLFERPGAPNGSACSLASGCSSGFCVDGVCCDSACRGGALGDCMACSVAAGAASDGACAPLAAGSACGDLGDAACDDPDSCDAAGWCLPNHAAAGAPCGDQGVACLIDDGCDGSGSCQDHGSAPAGATCRPAAGACDVAEACDGSTPGCPADLLVPDGGQGSPTCAPYLCAGAVDCPGSCGGDDDCAPDHRCDGGACVALLKLGEPCLSDAACLGDHCVDGVCCDSACGAGDAGDCQACSLSAGSAADGTCSPRGSGSVCRPAAGECDPSEACDGVATSCPADALAPDGTACSLGSCEGGVCAEAGSGGSGNGGAGNAAGNGGAGNAGSGNGGSGNGGSGNGGAGNGGAGNGGDENGGAGEGGEPLGGGAGTASPATGDGGCSCRAAGSGGELDRPLPWLAFAAAIAAGARLRRRGSAAQ